VAVCTLLICVSKSLKAAYKEYVRQSLRREREDLKWYKDKDIPSCTDAQDNQVSDDEIFSTE